MFENLSSNKLQGNPEAFLLNIVIPVIPFRYVYGNIHIDQIITFPSTAFSKLPDHLESESESDRQ